MNYKISIENFIIITTTATLHKLFNYKHGSEAIALYMFYYYTAKWQKTNQIKATISYCMKGLNWGRDKVRRAKKILTENGLIEDVKRKDEKGKVVGWFIKINFIWSLDKTKKVLNKTKNTPKTGKKVSNETKNDKTTLLKTHRVENQPTNALSKYNINALSKYNIESVFEFWNRQKIIVHSKLTNKIKTKIKSTLKDYPLKDILYAIKKYKLVLDDPECFWTYKWTLPDFLQRGLIKFLDTPIDNFKIKTKKPQKYYCGNPVVEKNNKLYVISNGEWLEFTGDKKDIYVD